jgi:hypothetical protein
VKIGNESLHEVGNDNGVKVVNVATRKKTVIIIVFLHFNIHKYTWISPVRKTCNQI